MRRAYRPAMLPSAQLRALADAGEVPSAVMNAGLDLGVPGHAALLVYA